jgi:CubicO group peptidase (beta-lactamase class C family)
VEGKKYAAVVERGKVIFEDAGAPRSPWWSLSKTALATAALALVQKGELKLDSPLAGREFTLRHLLRHSAGLPDYGDLADYHLAVSAGHSPWSYEELFTRVEANRLRSTPGTCFKYSNIGYTIVRMMIEEKTGLTIGDALTTLVFDPLGIDDVYVATRPEELVADRGGSTPGYHPGWVFHGLIVSTPLRAALFLGRLFDGGLINSTYLEFMRNPVTLLSPGPVADRPWNSMGYGLGLMIDLKSPLGPCYGHTGTGPGSTTATYIFDAHSIARTISVFAPVDDQGAVERAALSLAERFKSVPETRRSP